MESVTKIVLMFVTAIHGATMMAVMAATGKTGLTIFIFGDSTADVGTNNHLPTCTARADHRYNGIDYAYSKATGRFSNGRNTADLIARLLGNYIVSPPPFLFLLSRKATFKRNILRGANFASGGAGIFRKTGRRNFHRVISMAEQIQQFATVRSNITELLGSPKDVDDLFQNSVYIISVGSNDLVEYTLSQGGQTGDTKQFMVNLTEAYATHLANLYTLGARKFGIIGIPPIGCCPAARPHNSSGGCFEVLNDNARSFYKSMQSLLSDFSLLYQGFKYSLGNTYAMTMNVIENPRGNRKLVIFLFIKTPKGAFADLLLPKGEVCQCSAGFREVKTACCGDGTLFHGVTDCVVGAKLCSNRADFLFWDKFHPTEKASEIAALTLVYGEGAQYVTPMNLSSLVMA